MTAVTFAIQVYVMGFVIALGVALIIKGMTLFMNRSSKNKTIKE